MKKNFFLTMLVLCTVIQLCRGSLSLPAAREISTSRPALIAQKYSIAANQKAEQQAFGGYLPQLSAWHNSLFDRELSINESAHTLSLRGSQLIFDANGPQFQTKIAELTTQQTTYAYQASSAETRYLVAKNFLQTWLLEQKKAYIEKLTDYITLLEKKNNQLLEKKIINQISWAATSASIIQHKATITSYPFTIESARSSLAQSMGYASVSALPATLEYTLNTENRTKKTIAEYITIAYNNRAELKSNQAHEKQYELLAQSNKQSYLPSVSAHGSISKTFAGAAQQRGVSSSVGFNIQWNFFDGLQHYHAAGAANAQKLRTTFERQELKNSITQAITATYNTIFITEQMIAAAQAQTTAQLCLLEEAKMQYENGTIDETTYLNQQLQYAAASYELCTQKVNLESTWQTLAWQCGYPASGVIDE
jgi:outer membrane protein TolC